MLVLTRKTQQQIQIGPNITITILRVKGQTIRVGIDAPRDVSVLRAELAEKLGGRADAATVQAAHAAAQREQQRASEAAEVSAPEEVTVQADAPATVLMQCPAVRTSGGQRLAPRNRRRLMAVASAVPAKS